MGLRNPASMQEVKYLFIDGGYLRKVCETLGDRYYENKDLYYYLDFSILGSDYKRKFYYDCLSAKKKGQDEADYTESRNQQITFFNSIRQIPGYHVKEGVMTSSKRKQKQVDVMLTVDMLQHTIRGNMQSTTLLAGDLDFKPIIDALVQEGMYTVLLYEPKSTNSDLIYSADQAQKIEITTLWNWLKPEYKEIFPVPNPSFEFNIRVSEEAEDIAKGTDKKGQDVIIYFENKRWVYLAHESNEYFYRCICSDLKVLLLYLEDTCEGIKWEEDPWKDM